MTKGWHSMMFMRMKGPTSDVVFISVLPSEWGLSIDPKFVTLAWRHNSRSRNHLWLKFQGREGERQEDWNPFNEVKFKNKGVYFIRDYTVILSEMENHTNTSDLLYYIFSMNRITDRCFLPRLFTVHKDKIYLVQRTKWSSFLLPSKRRFRGVLPTSSSFPP